jgi:hypothetical protein
MPQSGINYYMHLDGSQGQDCFGICMCHLYKMTADNKPIIKVDLIGAPNKRTYGNDFKSELLEVLMQDIVGRGFNLKLVTYDRATAYNIRMIKEYLEPFNVIIAPLSIDRTTTYPVIDYDKPEPPFVKFESTKGNYCAPMYDFRLLVNEGRLIVPYTEAWSDLPFIFEIDDKKKLVSKIPGKSDDFGQAVGGAIFNCLNNEKEAVVEREWDAKEKPDSFEQNIINLQLALEEQSQSLQKDNDFDKFIPDEIDVEDSEDTFYTRINDRYLT